MFIYKIYNSLINVPNNLFFPLKKNIERNENFKKKGFQIENFASEHQKYFEDLSKYIQAKLDLEYLKNNSINKDKYSYKDNVFNYLNDDKKQELYNFFF